MSIRDCAFVLAMLVGCLLAPLATAVDIDAFVKKGQFEDIKISPTGEYYAATMPRADRTVVVIVRRVDKKVVGAAQGIKNSVVDDFWWVNNERVVISLAEKFGSEDRPYPTGVLHAINADGSNAKVLVGSAGEVNSVSNIAVLSGAEYAQLIDDLPQDDQNILVSVSPYSAEPNSRVERVDVYTGKRKLVASAPVRRAHFLVDPAGTVRFAMGADSDNASKLYYRADDKAGWQLLNDESASGRVEAPLGFSADGKLAYLQVEQAQGTDAIVAMDVTSGTRTTRARDDVADPYRVLYSFRGRNPIGVSFMQGGVRSVFFDEAAPRARMQRSLESAFPDEAVDITSATADGGMAVFSVSSDRNPGDVYLYDTRTKRADAIFSRRSWFVPDKMAGTRSIQVKARDGLVLHGYLTMPVGKDKQLPLVVMPHGGPFGVYESWYFNNDAQLLASAGYAVLRIDYRGSGNHGRAFMHAGARQWGLRMQDDVTDATRWAIDEGVADRNRICIYGASYGAYAALMGVAKEPGLYRCAAGYVGVYDLQAMHKDDSYRAKSSKTWANDWLGERDALAAVSPVNLAGKIKAPVFLAAGGEDEIAPIKHSKSMERALKTANVPVETLYIDSEGHGFYTAEHQHEFYVRLLGFLQRNIGSGATP